MSNTQRAGVRIHPTADVSPSASVGQGTSIWHQCQVREGVRIGENCILGKGAYLDFGVQIGDQVKIQNGAFLYHGTRLESGVFVGPGVIFTNDKQPKAINPDGSLKGSEDWTVGEILVKYGASIGAGAVILPGLTIGEHALIGAGTVVTRDVSPHSLVIGNPARHVGWVCSCGERTIHHQGDQHRCPACDRKYHFQGRKS